MNIEDTLSKLIEILQKAGAVCAGVANARPISETEKNCYAKWLEAGRNATMHYLTNWAEIRFDPRRLLEGGRSIISLAFPYASGNGIIASYAQGNDYHHVIRKKLKWAVNSIKGLIDGDFRICIDSAPVLERVWAERCGIGTRGRNGLIYIPGYGSRVFLAEIITTHEFDFEGLIFNRHFPNRDIPREICPESCDMCGRTCPSKALQTDGTVDARRCLSYLTIEHRGEWDTLGKEAMSTKAGKHTLFGCDLCQRSCPRNQISVKTEDILPEFLSRHKTAGITPETILSMTSEEIDVVFNKSPLKRARPDGLRRNALNMLDS